MTPPHAPDGTEIGAERRRMAEARARERNWMRWGPYLAERQWGTVREDYSADGDAWRSFTHDDACRRAYRWGEDGLLGFTDRECRMCFALALWNGKDFLLKERLFGLTNPEGNHGEDVKELYYYLDATPTSSYLRARYVYPQNEFPYARLVEENGRRTLTDPEYELEDTGILAENRYFDVCVEYAKAEVEDVLVRVRVVNRGPDPAPIHVLPTVWFRNTWAWGRTGEDYWSRGRIAREGEATLSIDHPSLGRYRLDADHLDSQLPRWLFTENESDTQRLFGTPNASPFVKDAFHRRVVGGEDGAVNPAEEGTKAAAWYVATVPPGGDVTIRLRWTAVEETSPPAGERFGDSFTRTFERRRREADEFHASARSAPLDDDERRIVRQADAGLLWSRQFYQYAVETWLEGDPAQPSPPESRRRGRNHPWRHVHARDVLSVPDKWEYPWFAAWDLAFHCVALARIDPEHAKDQLLRLCREWYMNPSGQLPAYEYDFGAVNPPVHAWAAWRVYQLTGERDGPPDRAFLESAFHKCVINFTWWVNREDVEGDNLFTGGFLGLDNIGLFDRSRPIAGGGTLEQADATAWMAFYSSTMLAIALELARENDAYEGIASKFFEHFVRIAQAMNELGGAGLWDEADGFYYDHLRAQGASTPLRVRSMVGLIPLFAAESLESE
ncbi:MAG: glucosidase, partial [Gemmatimonadetes bacterium]|nr:glucosidase [Gemmatimonadota bacterium]